MERSLPESGVVKYNLFSYILFIGPIILHKWWLQSFRSSTVVRLFQQGHSMELPNRELISIIPHNYTLLTIFVLIPNLLLNSQQIEQKVKISKAGWTPIHGQPPQLSTFFTRVVCLLKMTNLHLWTSLSPKVRSLCQSSLLVLYILWI